MHDYSPKEERSSRVIVALLAFFISLPFLIHAIYNIIYPESVIVEDRFTPSTGSSSQSKTAAIF